MTHRKGRWAKAFTLIELMIAVSIIGILASIAIPKFAEMVRRAKEGTTKGALGVLRGALSIYYADMEDVPPLGCYSLPCVGTGLDALTVNGKYLTSLPIPMVPDYHTTTTLDNLEPGSLWENITGGVSLSAFPWPAFDPSAASPANTAYWAYFGDNLQLATWGLVVVCCCHTDSKGTSWSSY